VRKVDKNVFERIRDMLTGEGWQEQTHGSHYSNGEETTSFLKEGQIIGICHDTFPDEIHLENFERKDDKKV